MSRKRVFEELSEDDLQTLKDGVVSASAKKQNELLERALESWASDRATGLADLRRMEKAQLSKQLSAFIGGYRLVDGSKPKLTTIRTLWHALFRIVNAWPPKLDIKRDEAFDGLRGTVAALCKQATAEGRGAVVHKPPVATSDADKVKALFNSQRTREDPELLQLKVFYDIQSFFIRRGGEGLRDMTKSTFKVETKHDGTRVIIQAQSLQSKNYQGATASTVQPQTGFAPELPANDLLCPVKTFDFYLSKLHPGSTALWQRPLARVSPSQKVWYSLQPIGANKLRIMMRRISELADCSTVYTNHSLRSTGIVSLDNAGISDRAIMEVSAHKAMSSLVPYGKMAAGSVNSRMRIAESLAESIYGEKCLTSSDVPCASTAVDVPIPVPTTDAPSTSAVVEEPQSPVNADVAANTGPPSGSARQNLDQKFDELLPTSLFPMANITTINIQSINIQK